MVNFIINSTQRCEVAGTWLDIRPILVANSLTAWGEREVAWTRGQRRGPSGLVEQATL